jgi:alkanesulfonate monooxygenase SsuD/methylene tetrahydromethanopterin reductase-like flavin-dependent oxidoreductase (luciferase family)
VEQAFAHYEAHNPQYVRMLSSRDNWVVGTPDQARGRLTQLAEAGVDRALLSVNCELHREMLPLLGTLET